MIKEISLEVLNNDSFIGKLPDVSLNVKRDLPTSFYYNGGWLVTHKCEKCKGLVRFGVKTDKINTWEYSFKQSKPICSKNYGLDVIKLIQNIIPESIKYESEKGLFLGLLNEFDEKFPFSSSLKLNHYKCTQCNVQYIMVGIFEFGEIPEKSNLLGQNNQLHILRIFEGDLINFLL